MKGNMGPGPPSKKVKFEVNHVNKGLYSSVFTKSYIFEEWKCIIFKVNIYCYNEAKTEQFNDPANVAFQLFFHGHYFMS